MRMRAALGGARGLLPPFMRPQSEASLGRQSPGCGPGTGEPLQSPKWGVQSGLHVRKIIRADGGVRPD